MRFRLRFVTSNRHKFNEAKEILGKFNIELIHIPIDTAEIQSDDIVEVVIYKAVEASKIVDPPFVVEDTGLYIEALKGFPGVFASYIYKTIGLEGVLKLLDGVGDRRAKFVAVGALMFDDNVFKIFRHDVAGHISTCIKGDGGFGYDPIFIPEGETRSFAEMSIEEKGIYSHRGGLFRKIGEFIRLLTK